MKKFVIPVLASVSLFSSTLSCTIGKDPSSSVQRAEMLSEGRLYVTPSDKLTGGHLDYKIYDNGAITYTGEVSYLTSFDGFLEVEFQPMFHGVYRMENREALKSAYYDLANKSFKEDISSFAIEAINQKAKTANVKVTSSRNEDVWLCGDSEDAINDPDCYYDSAADNPCWNRDDSYEQGQRI